MENINELDDKLVGGEIIAAIMRESGVKPSQFAEMMGVTYERVRSMTKGTVRLDTFIRCLKALGWRMDIRPLDGESTVNLMLEEKERYYNDNPCEKCTYKRFSQMAAQMMEEINLEAE